MNCPKTGYQCEFTGCNALFCSKKTNHFTDIVIDDKVLDSLAEKYFKQVSSQYRDKPILSNKMASQAKEHFRMGMLAVLSYISINDR